MNLVNKNKEKNIIIDPFSCLTKLALMSYLNDGTKISINNNQIYFNDPHYNQGVVRFIYGDNREDLHNLFIPIQKAKEWFFNENDENIVYFFNKSVGGLKNLKKSYGQYATIQHTIDYYITVLINDSKKKERRKYANSRLRDTGARHMTPDNSSSNGNADESDSSDINITDREDQRNLDTVQAFLKTLWSDREIKIIIDLFKEYEIKEDEIEKKYVYESIVNYCNMKEQKLNKFLEEKSSVLDSS